MPADYDLDRAYEIHGPEDAKKLYTNWASTYDSSFTEEWGYIAPREIARTLLDEMTEVDLPILDIGAGTGAVAEHLEGKLTDAIDITPEMLAEAEKKNLYRNLIEADLTKPLDIADDTYGAVISCGTFTHGHVGPECFPELLRVTKKNAIFVCGTIPKVFDGEGFGSTLAILVAQGHIDPVRFVDIPIYENADHDHASDRGLVMVFRKSSG
ncbi:MAG: class I SAM-dependent methyltransferase [Pseudomonadota bacterium]